MPRVLAPEAIFTRTQARTGLRELERADDASPVVRMDDGGRLRVVLGQERVRAFGAEPLVDPLRPLALAGSRRRRKVELGQSGAQVEARAADDDWRRPLGEDLVDRGVG